MSAVLRVAVLALLCLLPAPNSITAVAAAPATTAGAGTTARGVLRIGIIGDWGMGGWSTPWQTEIRSANAYNEACALLGGCNITLSVGDNIYTGDVNVGLRSSFEELFDAAVTGPFFPTIGNHDNSGPQIAYASQNKRWKFRAPYYDFVVPIGDGSTGHTAHFFAVNTMDGSLNGGQHRDWLESRLAASTSRWKIIFGHYPTVGSGRHRREGSVNSLHGLMDKYKVQAYLCGHDHMVEVSNVRGKVMVMSGGMSRGGMMTRGIGGATRRFTLTQPGEFNKHATDWPGHGFATAELTANVLTVQIWDHYGAVMYAFAVTHDWMEKVPTMAAALEHQWPPPNVVRDAMVAEKTLPRGPGGGTLFARDGTETQAPVYDDAEAPKTSTTTTTTLAPGATTTTAAPATEATILTAAPPSTGDGQVALDAARARYRAQLPYISYAVSTECPTCAGLPTAGETFTVIVQGITLDNYARVFLSASLVGCAMAQSFPNFVPGVSVVQPVDNAAYFTASAASDAVVCLSVDRGATYDALKRGDDVLHSLSFSIRPGRVTAAPSATPGGSPVTTTGAPAAATNAPGTAAPAATSHSSFTLILVALLCLGSGAGIAVLSQRQGGFLRLVENAVEG